MLRFGHWELKIFQKLVIFVGIFILFNQTIWNVARAGNSDAPDFSPQYTDAFWKRRNKNESLNSSETADQGSEVMINTYMRSGSSFLGRVLGFREDTFYVYEPLWSMSRDFYYADDNRKCGTFVPNCKLSQELNVAWKALNQLYDCDFYNKPMSNIFTPNINVKLSGSRWDVYKSCINHHNTEYYCLKQMSDRVCNKSRHKVTKVLRISLANLQPFLESRPYLKVVHLFRDPRAMISSHVRTVWSPIRKHALHTIHSGAQAICERIATDVKYGEMLKEKFPNRFFIVQYEDFENPLPKLKKLFDLLDIQFTDDTKQYIDDSGSKQSDGNSHSGNHPFLYRKVMDWNLVQIINKYCADVYNLLGYRMFTSEAEFRNLSIPAVISSLPYQLP